MEPTERRIVLLVAAVQFVNILDFMMVMPLGPDFARALAIDLSRLGMVGGSYTLAAAVSGVVCSTFLDRFDRRSALAVCLLGLALGTALGGFSTGLGSLIFARVVAGAFGGPATALSLAVVSDVVPVARRGKALGIVMASFSIASILGVPAGLWLATRSGFRAPFFAVAALILLIGGLAMLVMPKLTRHLENAVQNLKEPLVTKEALISLSMSAVLMLGMFSIVPNISTFLQYNLGYPRESIGTLYLIGGLVSFAGMRLTGFLVDKFGSVRILALGTFLHILALFQGFVWALGVIPVIAVFSLFMLSSSIRMVPFQTLSTQVPSPRVRARFMSAQSAVQHTASAGGAFLSSVLLSEGPHGRLNGIPQLVYFAAALASIVPFLAIGLAAALRQRSARA